MANSQPLPVDSPQLLPRGATRPGVRVAATAALCLLVAGVGEFVAHLDTGVIDDHYYGYVGWRISQGATMYRDVWDHKPPGIHWLNAAAFFLSAGSYSGVVALCAAAVALTLVLMYRLGAMFYQNGTAAIITILAALYLTHGTLFAGGNRAETFLIPCELAAVWLALRGLVLGDRRRLFASGACIGAAMVFKQSGFAAGSAIFAHVCACGPTASRGGRSARRTGAWIVAGIVVAIAVVVTVLALQGTLTEAASAIGRFNVALAAEIDRPWMSAAWWSKWFDRYAWSVLRLPLLLAVGGFTLAAARWHAGRRVAGWQTLTVAGSSPANGRMLLPAVWYAAALAASVLSPRSEGHQFLPTVPPLLLAGGYLIDALKAEMSLLRRVAERALVLVAFMIIAYLAWDAVYLQFQKASEIFWHRLGPSNGDDRWIEPTPSEAVGALAAGLTGPDDAIQCWDYLPGVYLAARRPAACRIPSAELDAVMRRLRGEGEYLRAFRQRPPRLIVIRTLALAQWSERRRADGDAGDELARWVDRHYRIIPECTREGLAILIRR